MKCWGDNFFGQLGNGTNTESLVPLNVVGLASGVQEISAGSSHTCALLTGGGAKCWGANGRGTLGDGTQTEPTTPVNVVGLGSGVQEISAGEGFTCAAMVSGGAKCWGINFFGQLGDGSLADRTTPVDVVDGGGLLAGVQGISAGDEYTCARLGSGGVKCWGDNRWGQLGNGTTTNERVPVDVVDGSGLLSGVVGISAGDDHICATKALGSAVCWGYNVFGELGDGTTLDRPTPADVVDASGPLGDVQAISAWTKHSCAVLSSGGVRCWGENSFGQLGDGTTTNRLVAVDVVDGASPLTGALAVSVGESHSCALLSTGGVKCWGANFSGELGNGTTSTSPGPDPVNVVDGGGVLGGVQSISARGNHTCARLSTGGVKCWGANGFGQLGNGTTTRSSLAVDVLDGAGLLGGVQEISVGAYHSCARLGSGGAKCWGLNGAGQLGDGSTTLRTKPVSVKDGASGLLGGVQSITAGDAHSCAGLTTGRAVCWGSNSLGQLGNGATTPNPVDEPVEVVTESGPLAGVDEVSAGGLHTCALRSGGGACWGDDEFGQPGDGSSLASVFPEDVVGLVTPLSAISAGKQYTCAVTTAGGAQCWGANDKGQLGNGGAGYSTVPVRVVGYGAACESSLDGVDCLGACAPLDWLGDGTCDAGQRESGGEAIYLGCPALLCDDGDCGCGPTVYVDPVAVCGGLQPCYASLQAGLLACDNGGRLEMATGTYAQTELLVAIDGSVSIRPGWNADFSTPGVSRLVIGVGGAPGGSRIGNQMTIAAGTVRLD